MNNFAHILEQSNSFSQAEIVLASEHLFQQISLGRKNQKIELEQKAQLLSIFSEMLRQRLYSKVAAEMDNATKVRLIKLLAKLKNQLEVVELLLSGEANAFQNLALAAEGMDRKTRMAE